LPHYLQIQKPQFAENPPLRDYTYFSLHRTWK
jgi:hypothetical protein